MKELACPVGGLGLHGSGPLCPYPFCLQIPGPLAGRMKVEGLSLTNPQGKRAGPLGEKMEQAALGEEESWTPLVCTFANPL